MIQASRILVPLKGAPSDYEMVELACEVARAGNAVVHAIHVIEVKRTLPLDAELPVEAERGEQVLNRAEQVAERAHLAIDTALLQARDVGPAIVDEALEREIDLIILGISHKKRFGDFEIGKAATYVLKQAPCRVWVCRQSL